MSNNKNHIAHLKSTSKSPVNLKNPNIGISNLANHNGNQKLNKSPYNIP